jgi:ESCRT-II complex subunit VPS36
LIIKADYAKLLNLKLTQQEEEDRKRKLETGYASTDTTSTAPSDSETTFIRSSLARLGLPTDAVTQDMVADERAYHTELAKELGGLLLGGGGPKGKGKAFEQKGIMEGSRGIVGLDEVWGAWNRARGVGVYLTTAASTLTQSFGRISQPSYHLQLSS